MTNCIILSPILREDNGTRMCQNLSVSAFFDLVFISQHYVLYPVKKTIKSPSADLVTQEPLVTSSEDA
ncbi:PQ-loop repeat family protein / transmembrane family protein [Artemisia annua]|uniref:PQ-loop repeat family protein / transmembrane family protein n=1 Tax=Artemisia annua TaxID=35608 RepID=A0A2U1Q056_ARTAN|nr:PQ-loop repeat family protein / transmembrane family protein [Artemisia annua]